MLKLLLFGILFKAAAANATMADVRKSSNCITYQVGAGTGCAWMCNYCANALGTYEYYFTNDVCVYASGGCQGYPKSGVSYTCCTI
jgi:hypothetical protein